MRRRKSKKKANVYIDDRGYPDQQQDWDYIFEKDYGKLLLKRRTLHPLPSSTDPEFDIPFDEEKHGAFLRDNLKISHLPIEQQQDLIQLVKKYWGVFNPDGVSIPVKDYRCHIDTGTAAPVRVRNVNY